MRSRYFLEFNYFFQFEFFSLNKLSTGRRIHFLIS
uniref:Uncharacterized protein n=1 Tax=Anguilla anguilla TaxID=7936 RepID=A0A0E9UNC5_ANGAN